MSTAFLAPTQVAPASAELTYVCEPAADRRTLERRRSPRVTLEEPLSCHVSYLGTAAVRTVSLGGATFVVNARPQPGMLYHVRLLYGDACTVTVASIYRTTVHDLYYSSEHGSRVRYLVSATFYNTSVATLNLLYRILGDHWVDPGDDDTTPFTP